jgi:hypothetical protein
VVDFRCTFCGVLLLCTEYLSRSCILCTNYLCTSFRLPFSSRFVTMKYKNNFSIYRLLQVIFVAAILAHAFEALVALNLLRKLRDPEATTLHIFQVNHIWLLVWSPQICKIWLLVCGVVKIIKNTLSQVLIYLITIVIPVLVILINNLYYYYSYCWYITVILFAVDVSGFYAGLPSSESSKAA